MLPFKKVELLSIWQFVVSFCTNVTDKSRANKSPRFVQGISFHISKQKPRRETILLEILQEFPSV